MNKKISIKVISNPGHAWASVSITLLEKLDILDKITPYSYLSGKRAYLEEDCDLSTLIKTLKEKNIDFELKSQHSDTTPIPTFPSFTPLLAEFSKDLDIGTKGVLYSNTKKCFSTEATIIDQHKTKFIIEDEFKNVYQTSKLKILSVFRPLSEKNCIHVYERFENETIDIKVRLVFQGDKYGLNDSLIHESSDPLVEFYDQKQFKGKGQFISRYFVSTLLEREEPVGLCLDGSIPRWNVSQKNMEEISDWLLKMTNSPKNKMSI